MPDVNSAADLAILGPKLQGHQLMGSIDDSIIGDRERTFSHMITAAIGAGLTVNRVVFRGFVPSKELQAKMATAAAAEAHRREAQMQAESQRQIERQEMEMREHRAATEQKIADAEFANKQRHAEHDRRLGEQAQEHALRLQRQQADHEREIASGRRQDTVELLTSLSKLGLDVTKYLCADARGGSPALPSTFDVRIEIAALVSR